MAVGGLRDGGRDTRGEGEELPAVTALVNRVFRRESDMPTEYPLMFAPENRDGLRIAVHHGVPAAHVGVCIRDALILGASVRVAGIGAVCTDPAHRGQGLASRLMEDARQYARAQGATLLLISGGRGLYHRLGYVTVGRFDRYAWTPAELQAARDPAIEVTGYRDDDLSEVVALHQREPIRFRRSASDWQKLLAARMLMNSPAELWLVRQRSETVAYLSGSVVAAPACRGIARSPDSRIRRVQDGALLPHSRRSSSARMPHRQRW